MSKKIISVFLSVLLVMSAFVIPSFAEAKEYTADSLDNFNQAMEQAEPGDTIRLTATINGTLQITKSVNIEFGNHSATAIDVKASVVTEITGADGALIKRLRVADNDTGEGNSTVVLDNIDIIPGGNETNSSNACIYAEHNNNTITVKNAVLTSTYRIALIYGSSGLNLSFENCKLNYVDGTNAALQIEPAGNVSFTNTDVLSTASSQGAGSTSLVRNAGSGSLNIVFDGGTYQTAGKTCNGIAYGHTGIVNVTVLNGTFGRAYRSWDTGSATLVGEKIGTVVVYSADFGDQSNGGCQCDTSYKSPDSTVVDGKVVHDHSKSLGEIVAEVPATCKTTGKQAYRYCTVCHKLLDKNGTETTEAALVIEKDSTKHVLVAIQQKAATCMETGYKINCTKCTVCGNYYPANANINNSETLVLQSTDDVIVPIDLNAHSITIDVEAKAATCVEAGNIAHKKCEYCGKLFVDSVEKTAEQVATAKLEHNISDETKVAAVAATCQATGNVEYYACDRGCGKNYDKNGKVLANVVTPKNADNHIDADLTSHSAKDSTCTVKGNKAYYTCKCGAVLDENKQVVNYAESIEIALLPHNLGEWKDEIPGTCQEVGKKGYYTCSECHQMIAADQTTVITDTDTVKDPNNHQNLGTLTPAVPITCTTDGTIAYYTCACGAKLNENKEVVTDLTVPTDGHHYTAWIEKVRPNCKKDGVVAHYGCERCDAYFDANYQLIAVKDRVIPTLGSHDYQWVPYKAPTCFAEGNIGYYYCYGCEKKFNANQTEITGSVAIEKVDHEYIDVKYTWSGNTCTATLPCIYNCGTSLYETTSDITEALTTAPTCTERGIVTRTAHFTSPTFVDGTTEYYTAALGHEYKAEHNHSCIRCDKPCPCPCHETGFIGYMYRFLHIFQKLFGQSICC